MSQRQTKSPWYVYGDVDFPLDRVAAQTPRAVHTASRREEGRNRRAEEDRQEAEGPEEVDCTRPNDSRGREAGGVRLREERQGPRMGLLRPRHERREDGRGGPVPALPRPG